MRIRYRLGFSMLIVFLYYLMLLPATWASPDQSRMRQTIPTPTPAGMPTEPLPTGEPIVPTEPLPTQEPIIPTVTLLPQTPTVEKTSRPPDLTKTPTPTILAPSVTVSPSPTVVMPTLTATSLPLETPVMTQTTLVKTTEVSPTSDTQILPSTTPTIAVVTPTLPLPLPERNIVLPLLLVGGVFVLFGLGLLMLTRHSSNK